jgi:hypothetical protein
LCRDNRKLILERRRCHWEFPLRTAMFSVTAALA